MSEINTRLEYIDTTKSLIKEAINDIGGTLTDESTFGEYPEQVKSLIETTIIPQSDLDKFVEKTRAISGFKQLYGTWDTSMVFGGLIDGTKSFVCPDNPDVTAQVFINLYNFYWGGTGYNFISGELPVLLKNMDLKNAYNSLGHRRIVKVTNNSDRKLKINFRLKILNSDNEVVHDFSTFTDHFSSTGQGAIELASGASESSYYMISPPPRALYDKFDEIDGEYYFTQNTLDIYNETFLTMCDRYELEFTAEEVS